MAKDVRAVHHPDKRHVEMPYAPALLVRRGGLLFLSGLTAAPVYHSHPHREDEFDLPPRMRDQAIRLMENLIAQGEFLNATSALAFQVRRTIAEQIKQ